QVPGTGCGLSLCQPAKFAEYLLVAPRGALVRTDRESHPLCGGNGLAAVGHHRHGNRTAADAEDLWNGGKEFGCARLPIVLVCLASREPAVHRFWTEAGMGICLALADFRRNDFRKPGIGPDADDGTRPE